MLALGCAIPASLICELVATLNILRPRSSTMGRAEEKNNPKSRVRSVIVRRRERRALGRKIVRGFSLDWSQEGGRKENRNKRKSISSSRIKIKRSLWKGLPLSPSTIPLLPHRRILVTKLDQPSEGGKKDGIVSSATLLFPLFRRQRRQRRFHSGNEENEGRKSERANE